MSQETSMNKSSSGSSSKSRSGQRKLSWYMKAPIRALGRARDLYVNSLAGCAGRGHIGPMMAYPARVVSAVPRGHSFHSASRSSSTEDDIRELIRGMSQRSAVASRASSTREAAVVPRSQSVAIGRIDEDQPCEFGDDVKVGLDAMYPRSRSCAVVSKTRVVGVVA